MKDFGHLFRNVVFIRMAFGRFNQGSYMMRFSLQKSPVAVWGMKETKKWMQGKKYYNDNPYERKW